MANAEQLKLDGNAQFKGGELAAAAALYARAKALVTGEDAVWQDEALGAELLAAAANLEARPPGRALRPRCCLAGAEAGPWGCQRPRRLVVGHGACVHYKGG